MNSINQIPTEFDQLIVDLGIIFDDGDLQSLASYLDLLLETNRMFNLTAIKDVKLAWTKHILDSLSLLPCLSKEGVEHVIDVGSGGGLPGIPLAITMPEVTFTLLECTKKKAIFLDDATSRLGLDNVTILAERAEDLATEGGGFRDSADAVIARAVGPLSVLLELTIPFVKVGGIVLAIKGEKAAQEIENSKTALKKLHAEVESSHRTTTGTVLRIRKLASTPKEYPRFAGEPKRSPIGKGVKH
jgi:16S rRNA (guanine527-N7)-methyltransferase